MDHAEFLRRVRSYIKVPTKEMEEQLAEFCNICTYISGQYDKDESFVALNKHLEELETGNEEQHRVFYMALPPNVFISVSEQLKKNCYPKKGITRIIVRLGSFRSHPSLSTPPLFYRRLLTLGLLCVGGETLWEGPRELSGTANRSGTQLEGRGDIPYRPLPRQRDGEEPSHLALR